MPEKDFRYDPAVLRQLLGAATARLAAEPDNLTLLWRVGELQRSLGELTAARATYERGSQVAPDHARFSSRIALMAGDGGPLGPLAPGPVPFGLATDTLTDEERGRLWTLIQGRVDQFSAAEVTSEQGSAYDPAVRRSHSVPAGGKVRALLMPALSRLTGIAPGARLDLQITAHTGGGFFAAHRDNGPATPHRRLTFVYYLHRQPPRFSGGDLLLFDEPEPGCDPGFTRILPCNGTLVWFPPAALHQVTRVTCDSDDVLDGRLTVNGWLLDG